jgi:hypothetical protein
MEGLWQTRYHKLPITLLLGLIVAVPPAGAQQATTPTLDEILLWLENNLDHYDKQVPNFFCSEHVVSSLIYGKKQQSTVTDSIFRVTRDLSGALTESREVKVVNGTQSDGKQVDGPVTLRGVFSGGLDAVSIRQKACMNYSLQPIEPERSGKPYVIEFATLPDIRRRSGCVLKEEGTGRVFVDPTTKQVTRMELLAPHHVITSGEVGVWNIRIDYAPISLVGQMFWMPTTITSTATPGEAYSPTVYSFSARYSDYHKLEVTSHIVSPQ